MFEGLGHGVGLCEKNNRLVFVWCLHSLTLPVLTISFFAIITFLCVNVLSKYFLAFPNCSCSKLKVM